MKVALVHELLTMRGGAERVLRVLARMFPDAPIYTLLYDEKALGEWFPSKRVRVAMKGCDHHLYLQKFPAAVETWDFSAFDLVISSSSAFAHGIITNGHPKHLCYVHSPARYLWDRTHDVLERAHRGLLGPLKRAYLEKIFHTLRQWDSEVAPRPDVLVCASKEVQRRVQLYWDRTSTVIYPPIDDAWFESEARSEKAEVRDQKSEGRRQKTEVSDYFLIVSSLVDYKRIDIAINACNHRQLPVKIAGEGPERKKLERMAGPSVEFLGYVDHPHLIELYQNARALIVPGEEDFGLTPLEAMSQGCPIIAYKKGGLLETVIDGETGLFFEQKTPESLGDILHHFDHLMYSREKCLSTAEKFRESTFVQKMHSTIETMMNVAS